MKLSALLIFLLAFMTISFGVPFILVAFLPTIEAMLGSFGITLISGIILFFVIGRLGWKDAQT